MNLDFDRLGRSEIGEPSRQRARLRIGDEVQNRWQLGGPEHAIERTRQLAEIDMENSGLETQHALPGDVLVQRRSGHDLEHAACGDDLHRIRYRH